MAEDPFGGMAGAAIGMHELYLSYVAAGFTAEQAMQMICAMLAAMLGGKGA